MSLDDVNSLSERTCWLALKILGGPLPRARRPRSGRALSRAKGGRVTKPPSASRRIRVTIPPATPRHGLSVKPTPRYSRSEFPLTTRLNVLADVSRCRSSSHPTACHRRPAISFPLHLGGHPRRQWCDGAAAVALEATRLRRVLHCVAALRDASVAWVPQAPRPPRSRARRRGNRPPPGLRS